MGMGGRLLFWDQWGGGGNFDEPAQLSSTLVWVYVSHQPPLAISALTALMAWMLPWRGDSPRRAPPPSRSSPPPPRYIQPAAIIRRLGRGEGRTVLNVWFPLPIFVPGALLQSGSLAQIVAMPVSFHWSRAYTSFLSGESAMYCLVNFTLLPAFVRHFCTEMIWY